MSTPYHSPQQVAYGPQQVAYHSPELPWWFEAYQDSTVLVAYVANYDSVYKSKPEAQLFFMHQLVQHLDAVILKSENRLWRMHAFSLPFYCVLCPQCNSPDHANLVFDVALELAMAASQVSLPCGDPVDLRLGLASGRSSAGVVGATGVTFVVTGKIAQGAKHFAEHTDYLTASEDTWRKLNAANKHRGLWRRSALFAIPSIGALPCFDYHPAPAAAPAPPSPPQPVELRYTIADITDECHRLELHPPSTLPWIGYSHPGIELAYRRWLTRDPTPLHRVVMLLCVAVLMSTQLRVVPHAAAPVVIGARLACASLPFLVVLLHSVFRKFGFLVHEVTWVVLVLVRKALFFYPTMTVAASTSSSMLPHVADLLDCVMGLVAFKARSQLQAAGCLWAWAASMLWALLQLRSGAVGPRFTLSAWLFGTASLVLQAWLMARWELHKRRHFLRLVAIDSAAKPGKDAARTSILQSPTAAPSSSTDGCGASSSFGLGPAPAAPFKKLA